MSIFSDHKCGALSDDEFECECARMNNQDRVEREEFEQLYQDDDDSEGGLIDEED